ncbi:3-phenylpropionate/cinnamic acid dioxygenase subunit beta [Bacillus sp. 1P10SD]|uniref:3-phenylpropionate/cinnamic acid dioxygenase subunit beta n=1 Tax=Bacillus sp. 1P10SD TaxID=3132265 RepID=UPI0039A5E395
MRPEIGIEESQVSIGVQMEITNFLYREAYLLDHRKYQDWLDLLGDDLVYQMPARITNEGRHDTPNIDHDSRYFEDTKQSLVTRIKRLDTSSAWAEFSGPRQRHFITNILIEPGTKTENYQEFHVKSNFLFKRNRGSYRTSEELFGEREDILRKHNGEWKLVSRLILLDQTVLGSMNLSMFL